MKKVVVKKGKRYTIQEIADLIRQLADENYEGDLEAEAMRYTAGELKGVEDRN